MCDALCDKNKLFSKYINISSSERLHKIIDCFHDCFHDLTGLPNICEAIDGTHMSLTSLNKKVTLVASDCFNKKKIHSIVMQAICDVNKKISNVCVR
jgi:hypothetical protein